MVTLHTSLYCWPYIKITFKFNQCLLLKKKSFSDISPTHKYIKHALCLKGLNKQNEMSTVHKTVAEAVSYYECLHDNKYLQSRERHHPGLLGKSHKGQKCFLSFQHFLFCFLISLLTFTGAEGH